MRATRLRQVTFHMAIRPPAAVPATSRRLSTFIFSSTVVGRRLAELVDDLAVGEEDHAVGVRGGDRVVGDHHDRLLVLVDAAAQEAEHLGTRRGVEVAGRLVGEDDLGPRHECAGAGDALLLPAGELVGPVAEPVSRVRPCR